MSSRSSVKRSSSDAIGDIDLYGALEGTDELVAELYNRPGHLIRRAYQIAMALFIEEVQGVSITQLQYVVLRAIHHYPNQSHRRLSELTAIDRTTIGWVIAGLEQKGLVAARVNQLDRRKKHLELTNAGLRKLSKVNARMPHLQARILEPLTAVERDCFMRSLRKIVLTNNRYSRAPLRPLAGLRAKSEPSTKPKAGAPRTEAPGKRS